MIRFLAATLLIAATAIAQDSASLKLAADRRLESGDSQGAFELYQQAVAAVAAGPESADAAALLLAITKQYYIKEDAARCKAFAERAAALQQRLSGPDSVETGRALVELGLALYLSGDYAAATPRFETALRILQERLGPEDHEAVETLNRLALNLLRAGDTARARILEEQSLAICDKTFGPDHRLTAEAHHFLGQILLDLGDYPASQKHQLVALAALERRIGNDAIQVGDMLLSMGNTASVAGYFPDAKQYFERAAVIYEAHLGPHATRVGGALDNLGQTLASMKLYSGARSALQRALEIQSKELGPRHPWTGNILQSLAKVESAEGNYEKARELFGQNLSIWREKLGPEHPFTVVSMTLLSDVLAHLGRFQEALDTALDAVSIRRENILLTVRTLDERQALQYAGLQSAAMDTALSIAVRPGTSAASQIRVWDALVRSRALVLDEMSARYRTIHTTVDPSVTLLAEKVAGARSRVSKLMLQGPGAGSVAEYNGKLERGRADLQASENQLAVVSAGFRHELDQHRTDYLQVRKSLPPGSALVAFRRYQKKNYQAPGDSSTPSYVAFVLSGPAAQATAVPLGSAAHIEQLVADWRAEIDRERTSLGRSAKSNEAAYRIAGEALRAAVWDPLQPHLKPVQRLFIVPDGALQLVNFEALPARGGKYLVETAPLIHLLPAERDLADARPALAHGPLLAVANPDFEQAAVPAVDRGVSPSCGDFASTQFGSLPASTEEAAAIERIWKGRGWQAVELTGKQATEAAVKKAVAGKRVVHFATHGFYLDAGCPENATGSDNPLSRSGLVLAGANLRQKSSPNQDDGILTAQEVASLDLGQAEWVVLSGCDTGVGAPAAGEGVLGLRRSFQEAGARTLIASLWPVDDREARLWMAELYRARFVSGRATAESLRDADRARLQARRAAGQSGHPFYWAGFVAVGDWR
ncbi:MAG TPA: CHAT domain-containing tetratricopeptide repeat protein [Candidatus Sulfopaludibacter sp.]|nr:CHAT domain-containing tetratricopeptide repeat protein [Candidatus Sulfopaludibacter sp.]